MRENLSDKTLEREISPLSPPAVNLSNSIQENSDQEIHISKSTSKLFLEFMIFATFRMCMLKNADWQIFIATIGKKSREALTNRWQRKLKLKKKNIFHRRLTRLFRQPVKRDINGFWNSPTTPRQIVGVVAFFHSFFMHIQSFSLSHLYSAMNACDILPLNQVLLSAICFLLLWPHLELGGCYPAVWWRWWIEPIRTDELEVFPRTICISRWGALFTLLWSLLSHSPKHCFHWRLLQHLQIDEPFQRHQLSFWG